MKLPHYEIKMIIMHIFKRFLPQIGIGLALVVLAVIVLTPSPAPAQPVITWTPESVSEIIVTGEAKTISVSFTAAQNLGAVDIRVTPELTPYVSTNPTLFQNIAAGQAVNLDITISAPADASPQSVEGTIQIRNAGRPPRNFARPLAVTVTISAQDTGLPPDPGEAGKATLEGIDSDNDGVRDDIQRYIALTYPDSERTRAALTQYVKSTQEALFITNDEAAARNNADESRRARACLRFILGDLNEMRRVRVETLAHFLNTDSRSKAFIRYNSLLSGQVFELITDRKAGCDFNPDAMKN